MVEDVDFAYALSLQDQFDRELNLEKSNQDLIVPSSCDSELPLSVVDESWELVDPIPDIRQLFLQFNDAYFSGLLGSVEVRWSPRMTFIDSLTKDYNQLLKCAGLCCYEGRGGLCSIRLSQPLLKLRPRKDLVQTLLHEMIHALLFVTHNNKDHDAHGPEFLKHMQRINMESGANITVYHTFHDEVNLYRQHWWKCDGPCHKRPPYYGIVRRAMNRAPSPRDSWWADHQRTCGGTYAKIKEPESYGARKTAKLKLGKNEAEKGFRGKGQVFSAGESGTLPHYLKRKSGENQKANGNSLGSNKETVKRRKQDLDSDSVESEPDDHGAVKGKQAVQGVLSRSAADVVPFSGPGRMLGCGSIPNLGKEPSYLPADMNRPHKGETGGAKTSPVIVIKTPSPSKVKPTALSTLTIVDAFKRIMDQSEAGGKKRNSFSSPLLGSRREAIELLEDSPDQSIASSQSAFQAKESVVCPVCKATVKTSAINEHLDTCL